MLAFYPEAAASLNRHENKVTYRCAISALWLQSSGFPGAHSCSDGWMIIQIMFLNHYRTNVLVGKKIHGLAEDNGIPLDLEQIAERLQVETADST